jgi:hypothetical protein
MNKTLWIVLVTFCHLSCNPGKDDSSLKDEVVEYSVLCVSNNLDSNHTKQQCIPYSNDLNKKTFEILSKLDLYKVIPDSGKYVGQELLIITDTLGGGVSSDGTLLNGITYYISDLYYNYYEYNENGLIKTCSYEDDSRARVCIEVVYHYEDMVLKRLTAINPRISSNYDDQKETFQPDTLFKVYLTYDPHSSLLSEIKVVESERKTNYNITYRK